MTFACTGAAGTACRFHFDSIKDSDNVGTAHGPGTHFVAVYATTADVNHTQTIHGKFTDLFVSNTSGTQTGFVLYAEMTSIPASKCLNLLGLELTKDHNSKNKPPKTLLKNYLL